MDKKEALERLLGAKEKRSKDKNYYFIERIKLYFLLDCLKKGDLNSNQVATIIANNWDLETFITLIKPKVEEIDQLTLEKLLEKF